MKKVVAVAILALVGCQAPVQSQGGFRFEVSESVDGKRIGRLINNTPKSVCVYSRGSKPEVKREWWDGNEWTSRPGDCGFGIGPSWVEPGETMNFEFLSGGGNVRLSVRIANDRVKETDPQWIVVYGEPSNQQLQRTSR